MADFEPPPAKRVISGGTSAIGAAVAERWKQRDHVVSTVLRPHIPDLKECAGWDTLLLCTGTLHPAQPFLDANFGLWAESFGVNLFIPLDVIHQLWPLRNTESEHGPCVIAFSGAGVNGPAHSRSSYAASKIALAKMIEMLDDEREDGRFVTLGPGWVRTPIQDASPREPPEPSYWQPMSRVVDFVCWAAEQPRDVIGGRNLSIHDRWEEENFAERMRAYRRFGKMMRANGE